MDFNYIFSLLSIAEDQLWGWIGFPLIMFLGGYFSFKTGFIQIRKFWVSLSVFTHLLHPDKSKTGVHPLKAFFASVGGCIGIGNIVAICSAVQIGGPGALFWVWITAIVGMTIKYSEIYLGLLTRVKNREGSYDGGPMYYLKAAFKKSPWIANLVSLLLCLYGIEIYQFNIVATSISSNFSLNQYVVAALLLGLVIYAVNGGVRRVGAISSAIIPIFIALFMGMGFWIILKNISLFPQILGEIVLSAFTGHAAVGGFVGSSLLMTISQGIRRGCYSSDVGVGYASVIHSESSTLVPQRQAVLAFFEIFIDTFVICTMSIFLILTTGVWKEPIHESKLVQEALSHYFPYMNYFMPFFLLLLGYSTIIAYFVVGVKCANFLAPKKGKYIFFCLAALLFLTFSVRDTHHAMTVMAITQFFLVFFNLIGFFKLRDKISFDLSPINGSLKPHEVKTSAEIN